MVVAALSGVVFFSESLYQTFWSYWMWSTLIASWVLVGARLFFRDPTEAAQ